MMTKNNVRYCDLSGNRLFKTTTLCKSNTSLLLSESGRCQRRLQERDRVVIIGRGRRQSKMLKTYWKYIHFAVLPREAILSQTVVGNSFHMMSSSGKKARSRRCPQSMSCAKNAYTQEDYVSMSRLIERAITDTRAD